MTNFIKRFWKWILTTIFGVGIVLAASNLPFGGIPSEFLLKADKSDIIYSKDVNDVRVCDADKDAPCQNFGKIKSYYYRGNEVPEETYKGLREDLSKRTADAQFFNNGDQWIAKVYFREKFSPKNGKWFNIEIATTTIDAFDKQISFLGNLLGIKTALATVDTSTTISADNTIRQTASNLNYGLWTHMYIQQNVGGGAQWRGLVRFTMPADLGGTISKVVLYYYNQGADTGLDVEAHQITQTAWVEGTGVGDVGTSNWDQYSDGNNWASAGGDYSATIIDTITTAATAWSGFVLMGTGATNPLTLNWGDTVNIALVNNQEQGEAADFMQRQGASNLPYVEITYAGAGGEYFSDDDVISDF